MATRTPPITTAEQLLAAPDDLGPCELVRGELIMMTPAGFRHGDVEVKLIVILGNWNRARNAGRILSGDTGFILERDPDTVRAPDVAFVRKDRVPEVLPQGFFPGPPDLAVEVRSPDDRPKEIQAKIDDYLRLGVQVVWDVDPETTKVIVHKAGSEPQRYSADETLTVPELLPGFKLLVAEIFAD
jgi:Uma2 family endonuclease